MNIRAFNKVTPYIILTFGLGICMFLMLHRLGDSYITPWDEVVHVVVAHNLSIDCCVPKLHTVDLGTGESDWTNNYIWVHKPLLPFYLRAGLYHLFGESLFMFRLPSALFALLNAVMLFFIAKRLSHVWVAVGIAIVFASNQFVFDLVRGREFSDLSDVMSVFFLTVVLGLTLGTATGRPLFFLRRQPSTAYFTASLAAAIFTALAYNCKGGLALPGLGVLALSMVWQCGRRGILHATLAILFFGALVFPESFYLRHRFPAEFHYEQLQQVAHLFADVEGWARPWDYYINVYWPILLGLPLAVFGLVAMMASLQPRLQTREKVLLVVWVLAYLVPLSFGVSKVPNFILPVLPAVILLVGFCSYDLLQSEQRDLLYPLTGVLLLVGVLYHFNILQFHDRIRLLLETAGHHFLLLGVSLGIVLLSRLLSFLGKILPPSRPSLSPNLAVAIVVLMFISVIAQTSKKNWDVSNELPPDYEAQMAIKVTTDRIKGQIPANAVVLVGEANVANAHLYFQYWSGINSLPAEQLVFAKRTLSGTYPLYLLSENTLADATLITRVPYGYLYRIN